MPLLTRSLAKSREPPAASSNPSSTWISGGNFHALPLCDSDTDAPVHRSNRYRICSGPTGYVESLPPSAMHSADSRTSSRSLASILEVITITSLKMDRAFRKDMLRQCRHRRCRHLSPLL